MQLAYKRLKRFLLNVMPAYVRQNYMLSETVFKNFIWSCLTEQNSCFRLKKNFLNSNGTINLIKNHTFKKVFGKKIILLNKRNAIAWHDRVLYS